MHLPDVSEASLISARHTRVSSRVYCPDPLVAYQNQHVEHDGYRLRARAEAAERRAEVEELERQLAKLAIAKKDAESAEKLAEVS